MESLPAETAIGKIHCLCCTEQGLKSLCLLKLLLEKFIVCVAQSRADTWNHFACWNHTLPAETAIGLSVLQNSLSVLLLQSRADKLEITLPEKFIVCVAQSRADKLEITLPAETAIGKIHCLCCTEQGGQTWNHFACWNCYWKNSLSVLHRAGRTNLKSLCLLKLLLEKFIVCVAQSRADKLEITFIFRWTASLAWWLRLPPRERKIEVRFLLESRGFL